MPTMPTTFRPGGRSRVQARREYDRARGSSTDRLYDAAWARAAMAHRRAHRLCAYCELEGRVTAGALVDHFWPHRGDRDLFWRREFWVTSCAACHNGMKQAVEREGFAALVALARRMGIPVTH